MPEGVGPDTARAWTSRSFGSRLQHGIFYALIRLGGRPAAVLLLRFVAAYYVLFRPSIRGRTDHYLARRFPGLGGAGRLAAAYRLSFEFGQALIDRAAVGILGPGAVAVEFRDGEILRDLLAEGRGLILATAHAGCWQAAMAALARLETPVSLLMHREAGDVDRHYFEHAGIACPYQLIDPNGYLGGALEMAEVLRRGQVLCVMGDRVLGGPRSSVAVDFLGAPAALPVGAYRLAAVTGAPVAVLFTRKTSPGRHELWVADVIHVPPAAGRTPEALRPYAQRFAASLGAFTRNYPYQFFNFHDMWGEAPPDRSK